MNETRTTGAMIREWRKNPVKYAEDVFGVELDEWQKDALIGYSKNQRSAFVACKGPGKTAMLAIIGWHFLDTYSHPKIAATSISEQNLSDGLWTEMAKWQQKSPRLMKAFKWNKTRIHSREFPETWWMSARTWAKGADANKQADTLAGLHADFILFLLDEAGGIPSGVMAAADAALANDMGDGKKVARIVIAGNPTHTEGPLYMAATKERHLWHVININSDPTDPKRTPRVSKEWAQEQIDKYGRDNPWVLVNVFGQFPPASFNQLIGLEEVEEAARRCCKEEDFAGSQKRIGVDVARQGDDATILMPRQGLQAFKAVEMRNAKSHEIVARLMSAKNGWGSEMEFVDGTGGFGAGVVDGMLVQGFPVQEIHFSSRAIDSRFANKRAEMYFLMAEWIKRGGCIPHDLELIREIAAPNYTFDNKGRFIIEPKDDIKVKLQGHSPDRSDALALTFALPEMKTETGEWGVIEKLRAADKKKGREYDPFHDL